MSGKLTLVSLGPGAHEHMTLACRDALQEAEVVVGYSVYIDLIAELLSDQQEIVAMKLGAEVARAELAIKKAQDGQQVALISSGDIGVYGMAAPVFQVLAQNGWRGNNPQVEVLPGVSAFQATAAKLGAAFGHDFCVISLSDLLTPWDVIEKRLRAAAAGDFVIALYNPRSQKRDWQLSRAFEILLEFRGGTTLAVVARQATREEESLQLTTLDTVNPQLVDMFSLVVIGNSQTSLVGALHWLTPRGYTTDLPSF